MPALSGIILIIAALFNLLAGAAYLGGGALSRTVTGMGIANIERQAEQAGGEMSKAQQAQVAKMTRTSSVESGALFALGVFLLVSVIFLIIGAVCLFRRQRPAFVYFAGGVAILAEAIGILLVGFGVKNLCGLVGGLMAVISARMLRTVPPDASPEQ